MAEARSALGRLVASVVVDASEFVAGTTKADHELARFQRSVDQKVAAVERRFSEMGRNFAAGLAAAISIDAIKARVSDAIDALDEINKFSERTGVAAADLQELGYVAKLQEASLEALATGFKKLQVNMAAAEGGNKEMVKAFGALGISTRDPKEALLQLADIFKVLPDGPERSALAVKLFDKAGDELIPVLNLGRAGIAALGEEAKQFGLVTGPEAVKLAAEFKDNLDRISEAGRAAAQALAAEILPGLVKITEQFIEARKASGGFLSALIGLADAKPLIGGGSLQEEITKTEALLKKLQSGEGFVLFRETDIAIQKARLATLRKEFDQIEAVRRKALFSGDNYDPGATAREAAERERQNKIVSDRALARARRALEAPERGEGRNKAIEYYFAKLKEINLEEERNLEIIRQGKPLEAERIEALKRQADLDEFIAKLKREGTAFDANIESNLRKTIQRAEALAKEARELTILRDVQRQVTEEREKAARADVDAARGFAEQTTEVERQIALIGKTALEVENLRRSWEDNEITRKREARTAAELDGEQTRALDAEIKLLERRRELRQRQNLDEIDRQFNPGRGAREAVQEYLDYVEKAGERTREAVGGSFRALEAQLTEFITTGKFSFKDLVASIQREFARLAAQQIIRQVFGLVAGGFGGAKGAVPNNAQGGDYGAYFHAGGVVGQEGGRAPVRVAWFAGAPRYHAGGLPGLKANEVPAILQRGEGVFTAAQMRAMGGAASTTVNNYNIAAGTSPAQLMPLLLAHSARMQRAADDQKYRRKLR